MFMSFLRIQQFSVLGLSAFSVLSCMLLSDIFLYLFFALYFFRLVVWRWIFWDWSILPSVVSLNRINHLKYKKKVAMDIVQYSTMLHTTHNHIIRLREFMIFPAERIFFPFHSMLNDPRSQASMLVIFLSV